VAKLAPADGATIHVAKYLDPDAPSDAKSDERQLEGLLDLVQPGWRELVVERRFLPSMTVYHAMVTAAQGGTAGRPGPAVPGIANLYVVGDWVGAEGLLADASLSSAKQAARLISRAPVLRAAAAA
jgi:phytoene dehydrogenase-like protein